MKGKCMKDKLSKNKIIQAALDAGFLLSTAYGSGKLIPVTDIETLVKFAEALLETKRPKFKILLDNGK
jgi:hypothetical protein